MKIILASGSPRRKEILEQLGISFQICPAKGEERITKNIPAEVVAELSLQKAEEVARSAEEGSLILGADTIVAFAGKILGKPKSEEEAVQMLQMLSGEEHQVYTGVSAIIKSEIKKTVSFVDCTDVRIYPMEESEIRAYVKTGEPMDKAGAYAVQGLFARYIEGIRGDFYNVMGLPAARLCRTLKENGIII